jgi:7-cyano-7-deazaguanine synthase
MSDQKALVLFSAGQDSATCLAWALSRYEAVETIGFDYGQRHAIELTQRPILLDAIRRRFPEWSPRLTKDQVIDIRSFGALAQSALTTDGAIDALANGLPSTFVPGRNLAFLTYAAAHAYLAGIDVLVTGVCQTDYSGYPDCREETMAAMQSALRLGMESRVRIETPLMFLTKAETWALAHDLGSDALVALIREETHTCYRGDRTMRHEWGYGCGDCPACDLRAKGWAAYHAGAKA